MTILSSAWPSVGRVQPVSNMKIHTGQQKISIIINFIKKEREVFCKCFFLYTNTKFWLVGEGGGYFLGQRTIFWYIAETITIAICYTYIVWEKNDFMLYCRNKERKYCYGKDAPPTSSSPDPWELILFVPNWWTSTLILLYQTISRSIGHVALVLQPIEDPTTFIGILNLHVMLNVTL